MFRRLPDAEAAPALRLVVDGRPVAARLGDSVAAALLAAGIVAFRRTPGGAPRGPFCMMGVCFDCLATVDGIGNRQTCLVEARDGTIVETGAARRDAIGEASR